MPVTSKSNPIRQRSVIRCLFSHYLCSALLASNEDQSSQLSYPHQHTDGSTNSINSTKRNAHRHTRANKIDGSIFKSENTSENKIVGTGDSK